MKRFSKEYTITLDGKSYKAEVSFLPDGGITVVVNGAPFELTATKGEEPVLPPNRPPSAYKAPIRSKISSESSSKFASRHVAPPRSAPDIGASGGTLRAIMPGRILAVNFKEGEEVKKGQPLIVLESMKMENAITSPYDGKLSMVAVSVGDSVQRGQTLVEFELPSDD